MRYSLIILLFISINVFSQQEKGYYQPALSYEWHIVWELPIGFDFACSGCVSFYWGVARSTTTNIYGQYHFINWFYSNSYNNYGGYAHTYLHQLNVFSDNLIINPYGSISFSFKEAYSPDALKFWSVNKYPYVHLIWQDSKIY